MSLWCFHCVMMTKQQQQQQQIKFHRKLWPNITENEKQRKIRTETEGARKFSNDGLRNDFMLPQKTFHFTLNESCSKISFPFVSNFDLTCTRSDRIVFLSFCTRKNGIFFQTHRNKTENPDLAVKMCAQFRCLFIYLFCFSYVWNFIHHDCFKFQIKYLCMVWFTKLHHHPLLAILWGSFSIYFTNWNISLVEMNHWLQK